MKSEKKRGIRIDLSGPRASGKTTIAGIIKQALDVYGYDVTIAFGSEKAMSKFLDEHDVVIVDY